MDDLDKTNEFTLELRQKVDTLSTTLKRDYCLSSEMTEKVSELDKFLRDNYITKTFYSLYNDKLKTELDKVNEKVTSQQGEIDKLQKELKVLSKSSATKTDIKSIQSQMENLCKYEDLNILYNKVVPAVQGFEENMIELE